MFKGRIIRAFQYLSIVSAILICSSSYLQAQPFGEQQLLCAGGLHDARQLVISEINYDGNPDIIISDYHGIQACFNNGDEAFSFLDFLVTNLESARFTISDFDGDGYQDIIHHSPSGNNRILSFRRNDGLGNFDNADTISTEEFYSINILSGDINNDTFQDFILSEGGYTTRKMICFHGHGDGTFTKGFEISIPDFSSTKVLVDIDQDNDLDAILNSKDSLIWYENDGNGVFIQYHIIDKDYGIDYFCVTDIDFDSDPDIIYQKNYDLIVWKQNLGQGVFSDAHLGDTAVSNLRGMDCGDIDDDGDIDVITCHYGGGPGVQIHENTGNNTFFNKHALTTDGKVTLITLHHLDNDSLLDVTFYEHGNNYLGWIQNTSNLTFNNPQQLTSEVYRPPSVTLGDLDNDDDQDIVTISLNNEIIHYENLGLLSFNSPEIICDTGFSLWSDSEVYVADFDGDQLDDIFIAGYWYAYWLRNEGSGTFGPPQQLPYYYYYHIYGSAIADIDNDNDVDIILRSARKVHILFNDGLGNFSHLGLISFWSYILADFTLGDIDGDQDIDVIMYSWELQLIAEYLNDGSGQFSSNPDIILECEDILISLESADMDGDDDIDLISHSYYNTIWFENTGLGHFTTVHTINDSIGYSEMHLCDLDDDTDLDLIHNLGNRTLVWSENNGDGTFVEPQIISDETYILSGITTGDLDNDGERDIVSASDRDNKIAWYENLRMTNILRDHLEAKSNFIIYPNPTRNRITITSKEIKDFELRLYDINGSLMMSENNDSKSSSHTIYISDLPQGIYTLVIFHQGNYIQAEKVIVME